MKLAPATGGFRTRKPPPHATQGPDAPGRWPLGERAPGVCSAGIIFQAGGCQSSGPPDVGGVARRGPKRAAAEPRGHGLAPQGRVVFNPNSEIKSPEQTEETEREALARTHAGTFSSTKDTRGMASLYQLR